MTDKIRELAIVAAAAFGFLMLPQAHSREVVFRSYNGEDLANLVKKHDLSLSVVDRDLNKDIVNPKIITNGSSAKISVPGIEVAMIFLNSGDHFVSELKRDSSGVYLIPKLLEVEFSVGDMADGYVVFDAKRRENGFVEGVKRNGKKRRLMAVDDEIIEILEADKRLRNHRLLGVFQLTDAESFKVDVSFQDHKGGRREALIKIVSGVTPQQPPDGR